MTGITEENQPMDKVIKPSSCIGCPSYGSQHMSVGKGVRPAEVVFISSMPPPWGGLYSDKGGQILKYMLKTLPQEGSELDKKACFNMQASHFLMYAVCCPGSKVNDTVDKCKSSVTGNMLLMANPKIVVAFGVEACHFMGISGNITDIRGTIHKVSFNGTQMKVIPTLPLSMLEDKPGLFDIVKNDLRKAAITAYGETLDDIDIPELLKGYDLPNSLEETISTLNKYAEYVEPNKDITNTMLSLDFETTTLFPWNKKGRVIAMSGCVGPGKAFSVLVDHREASFKFKEIAPYVVKVLNSKHPKCWWNYKYDYGIARFCLAERILELIEEDPEYKHVFESISGLSVEELIRRGPINNTKWDGMLGEHMLHEDKKGFYSLKEVVTESYPSLVGYEEKLHTLLSEAKAAKVAKELEDYIVRNPNTEDIVIFDNSPTQQGFELTNVDSIKASLKSLKAKARLKKTTVAEKAAYEEVIAILDNWNSSVEEELRTARDGIKSWLRGYDSGAMSNGDPRLELITFEDVAVEVMQPYAAIDADLTWRISNKQRIDSIKEDPIAKASAEGRPPLIALMNQHYIPLTEVLSEMQVEGVRIDRGFLATKLLELGNRERELELQILAKLKQDLNMELEPSALNSTKELANIFIAGYGLPKVKSTDGGEASTDKDTMEKYRDMGNPVASLIVDYRDIAKAKSTYVSAFLDLSAYDERIHGAIHLNGTATGRASSSSPNLQNITSSIAGMNIKQAFVPTNTSTEIGYERKLRDKYNWQANEELVMVDIDFSGAEIRGLTAYVKDEALIGALERNLDIHSWIASVIFNEDYEIVNKLRKTDDKYHQMRQKAKTIVFGLIYGISNVGLSDRLSIDIDEADDLMVTFFSRFPKIKQYIDATKIRVTKEGILRTPTGRARRFPLAQMGGQFESRNHRQGINYLVQSFCAEIVLRIINHLHKNLHKIRGRLVLTVHDSIVMEIPKSEVVNLKDFLKNHIDTFIASNFPQLPVAMPYDIKIGRSYGEAE
jgi:DNA polymerase I-like protein with 3'-5' exonuclease and polymerase domains/uracil-DNA glycosylase